MGDGLYLDDDITIFFPLIVNLGVQVTVTGAASESEAAKVARSVASSSLTKA